MNASLLLPILMTVAAGAAVAMQPAFNGQLAAMLGSPIRAALASFTAGATILFLLVLALVPRDGLPDARTLAQVPLHLWVTGGALGSVLVTTSAWAAPKIGTGIFFAILVAAQLLAALLLDHFGLLGIPERPINPARALGAVLLVVGAVLVVRA